MRRLVAAGARPRAASTVVASLTGVKANALLAALAAAIAEEQVAARRVVAPRDTNRVVREEFMVALVTCVSFSITVVTQSRPRQGKTHRSSDGPA